MQTLPTPSIPTPTYTTKIKTQAGLSLWQTRHSQVLKFIETHDVRTMIDFGSSECMLMQKVQRGLQVMNLIGVDIDLNIMPKAIENLKPETIQQDLQFERNYDQIVQLKHGSVLTKYDSLKKLNIDLVTLVEVIEHIEEVQLEKLNANVFQFLRPQYVWISTPNSDFNPLFNWQNGRMFRHDDHKFEWTRKQFEQYVNGVCKKYNYTAQITGVGESFQQEHRDKGFCSQIAIFEKISYSFDRIPRQITFNQHFNISSELLPTQVPAVPLNTVYSHTNYCWFSNKDHLIEVALKEVIYKLNDSFIPWSKLIDLLRKKLIFRKLSQHDDKWEYDYFIKNQIKNFLKKQCFEIKCEEDGILKLQHFNERTSYQDEMMEEELSELNIQENVHQTVKHEKQQGQKGPILYKYEINSLPRRGVKNSQNEVVRSKQNSEQLSDESSSPSQSLTSSSSSQNSWQSIQLPDRSQKRKVPRKLRRNFKPRKRVQKVEAQN